MPPHTSESPAKKQSKWSPEEDALIIELRGSGMKWDDISKRLPGRSSISCRLHYQNYLERRSEWDEERKNKLARLYESLKEASREIFRLCHRQGTAVAHLDLLYRLLHPADGHWQLDAKAYRHDRPLHRPLRHTITATLAAIRWRQL
ncbi:unnamed protein product [Sordaria macrospora k-hell]|uniref:WGS project CABT00000000 data, contig 2.3 n=1 Tax=Sordaria macrospora (strain ATCC MYA-333 / DSM 997 / K(L3346) / K-hell) TaxID=771870 RepID=F7VPH9_SORMK|nr:uncharacterized protein SMAC_02413 [Sordaria macrospora k-hell]CCC07407.1 unnamed protein product [Sordaria macrospora k-hell]